MDMARYLEIQYPGKVPEVCNAETDPSPRILNSHLPENFFLQPFLVCHPKVIVVIRNPKDTLLSFYHMHKTMPYLGPYTGTWDEFFQAFKDKQLFYQNIVEHTLGWWKHRQEKEYLFLCYEEINRDTPGAVRRIAEHCHVSLSSEDVEKIADHCQFDAMKASGSIQLLPQKFGVPVTSLMRKGQIGNWKSVFSAEQSAYIDDLCEKYFTPVGLRFIFE